MTEGSRHFLVGLVSLGALIGLVAMMILFGELDRFLLKRYVITIHTNHASGLRRGSSVEFNGVPIGVVDDVAIHRVGTTQEEPFPVHLTALIDGEITIPTTARPFAATSLLGGASILELEARPQQSQPNFLPKNGSAEISGTIRIRLLEQITSELDARMTPVTTALEEFNELSDTYGALGRNLNELFAPQTESALAGGEPPNLRTAVGRLDEVLETTQEALSLARQWLGDEELRLNAGEAARKATDLIDRASETLERFTKMAGSIERDADALTKALLPVADELAVTLEEVRRLTRLAIDGEGTVPQLLRNPDLYRSLDDAAVRLDQTLRELELFIKKVKAEGLPIQF